MKKILFLLFSFFITSTGFSQSKTIDSLLTELSFLKENTAKVDLLNSLSWEYRINLNQDKTFTYAQEALKLAEKLNYKKGKATALRYIGNYYTNKSDPDKALVHYQKALIITRETDDKRNMISNLRNLGRLYTELSDFPKSMENYSQALQLSKKIDDQTLIMTVHKDFGWMTQRFSNYPLALENYQKALRICEKSGDKQNAADILRFIGMLYGDLGNTDKALHFMNRSLESYIQLQNQEYISDLLSGIGNIYMGLLKYNKSLEYYNRSSEIKKKLNDELGLAYNYANIAFLYQLLSDYATAIKYHKNSLLIFNKFQNKYGELLYYKDMGNLIQNAPDNILLSIDINPAHRYQTAIDYEKRALKLAEDINDPVQKGGVLNFLIPAYEKQGDFKSAYYSLQNNVMLNDSIRGQSVKEEIVRKEVQYDFEKKSDVAKAEQEKKDIIQRTVRNSLIAGLSAFFLFSVIIYRQRNKVKKEKKRSDDLLLNILPEEIAEELKTTGTSEAKHFENVSIMFTDFKNFTKLSEKISSKELIEELNYCFKAFDEIIVKYGVEKIKTIGDSYMAVCGLPVLQENHAKKMTEAALEIRDFIEDYKQKRQKEGKSFFEMRIGINSGEVVAGIVGIKKFAYDIWGDAVNTASRMESNGVAGKVNISETTYNLVKNDFDFQHRGEIGTKGKGNINMYFVEHKQETIMEFKKAKEFILKKLENELPKHLYYHNLNHILDVYDAVNHYAKLEGIRAEDTELLKTASLFHDSGFIVQTDGHEQISCGFAEKYLSDFGYNFNQIEKIKGIIMATKIPQSPKNHLEQILADADLDYLGRDDFEEISNRLFEELKAENKISDVNTWNKIQISFFEKHSYFTDSAKRLRNEKKQQNLEKIKEQTQL